MEKFYDGPVADMPEIDIPIPGVIGKLLQGDNSQAVFFELPKGVEVPPHSHGAQWGCVLDGELILTIDGETKTYRNGDSYYIPAGAVHSGKLPKKSYIIDVFADKDRYKPKE